MGPKVSRATGQVWVALAATLAVLLVDVLPLMGGSPAAGTDLAIVSLALLTVAVVVLAASWSQAVAPQGALLSQAAGDEAPVPHGPATDPTHHPLAPRAPGLA